MKNDINKPSHLKLKEEGESYTVLKERFKNNS